MANQSQVTTIVKEGEKAAKAAGKCGELAAETPAHAETLKKLEEYKKKTFDGKSAADLTPADFKALADVNEAINKLEKKILINNADFKRDCVALPPATPAPKP